MHFWPLFSKLLYKEHDNGPNKDRNMSLKSAHTHTHTHTHTHIHTHTHTHIIYICVCLCVCKTEKCIFIWQIPSVTFVCLPPSQYWQKKNSSYFWKSTKLHYSCIIYLCSRIYLTNSASSPSRWEPNRRQDTKTQHKIGIFTAPHSLQKWVSFYICLYAPEQWMRARRDNGEQIWQFRSTLVLLTVGMRSSSQLALRVFM